MLLPGKVVEYLVSISLSYLGSLFSSATKHFHFQIFFFPIITRFRSLYFKYIYLLFSALLLNYSTCIVSDFTGFKKKKKASRSRGCFFWEEAL